MFKTLGIKLDKFYPQCYTNSSVCNNYYWSSEMEIVIDQLQRLGFSQYEAQAYIALLKENPANGYEVAKQSGIPRPSIYPVLQKLEERGAVRRVETPAGTRFVPLPPDDLLSKLKHQFQGHIEAASNSLNQIASSPAPAYTQNFHGHPELLDFARRMLESVRRHLLVITWPEEARALADRFQHARDRGIHLTTLCLNGCERPCTFCQGNIFRFQFAPLENTRWLILVADHAELLAGEITSAQDALAVYSRQEMLVKLATGYIQNSIVLAMVISGLGDRLSGLLTPQSQADLEKLQAQDRWFDTLSRLIRPATTEHE